MKENQKDKKKCKLFPKMYVRNRYKQQQKSHSSQVANIQQKYDEQPSSLKWNIFISSEKINTAMCSWMFMQSFCRRMYFTYRCVSVFYLYTTWRLNLAFQTKKWGYERRKEKWEESKRKINEHEIAEEKCAHRCVTSKYIYKRDADLETVCAFSPFVL